MQKKKKKIREKVNPADMKTKARVYKSVIKNLSVGGNIDLN